MRLFDKRGFLGGYAVVGAQIPLAVGVAFASNYFKQSRATICFFGEAAVNVGPFHESLVASIRDREESILGPTYGE